MLEFNERSRPKTAEGKNEKRNTFESVNARYEGQELILNAFQKLNISNKNNKSWRIC